MTAAAAALAVTARRTMNIALQGDLGHPQDVVPTGEIVLVMMMAALILMTRQTPPGDDTGGAVGETVMRKMRHLAVGYPIETHVEA